MNMKQFFEMLSENCNFVDLMSNLTSNHFSSCTDLYTSPLMYKETLYSQGKTGTCWLLSTLLCISIFLKEVKNIDMTEETVFSKSYLIFYDKIERTRMFLSLIDLYINDESKIRYLLNHLVTDRGQWNMAQNLILKYGLVPYSAMPDPFQSISSVGLNASINNMLRCYALLLKKGLSKLEKEQIKQGIMNAVHSLLVKIIGEPPTMIDAPKAFFCNEAISPQEFFEKIIEFPFDDYICICNFAKNADEYYEVLFDNNMKNGTPEVFLNLSDADFCFALNEQIVNDGFCWYTCDASKGFEQKSCLYDDPDYFKVLSGIKKYELIKNRLASPNHAMVLIYDKYISESMWLLSHNSKAGLKNGRYIPVSKDWVDKYTFQAVVRKENISYDFSGLPHNKIMPCDLFFT